MSRTSRRRRCRRLAFNASILLAAGCLGGDTVTYTPAQDDVAMLAVASSWSASDPTILALRLCEDPAAPEPENTCQVEHVVRGAGRGRAHEEQRGLGCGGCPFAAVAYVKGAASSTTLGGVVNIAGEFSLGREVGGDDPYAFPYAVALRCTDPGRTCAFSGTLHEDGSLELTDLEVPGAAPVMLMRTGTGFCQ